MTSVIDQESTPRQSPVRTALGLARRFPMIIVMVLVLIGAGIAYPGFYQFDNIRNILVQNTDVGVIAVGMTFVLISGGFDLSVGATYAMVGLLYTEWSNSMPLLLAALLALVVGGLAGVVNGLLITRVGINPFVATLASMSAFTGLALVISSQPIVSASSSFGGLGNSTFLGIAIPVYILVPIFIVGGLVLAKTTYGRGLYTVGGNREAARLSGMRVGLIGASVYVISGIAAAVGALVAVSRVGIAQPDVGANLALSAITIVIVGGTSFLGGEGAIWKTAVGFTIMVSLANVFDARAVTPAIQSIVTGVILAVAVGIDVFGRRAR
jgi:ribose transport system permease protein